MSRSSIDYAGDVDCAEAFRVLAEDHGARLIDVRTAAEWTFVGVPDLAQTGKRPLFVEWQRLDGSRNPNFIAEADAALAQSGAPAGGAILVLCRSGGRSAAAAAALTGAGYAPAYNVAGGFEGDLDAQRHRGARSGWKASGLPWEQS